MVQKSESNVFSFVTSKAEAKMISRLKKEYGFKSNRELVVALIRRACLSLDLKD